jgi:hypothetical protein
MGYNTASTESLGFPLSDEVKQLIDNFFAILDNSDKGSGDILADKIFMADGVTEKHHKAKGSEGRRGIEL